MGANRTFWFNTTCDMHSNPIQCLASATWTKSTKRITKLQQSSSASTGEPSVTDRQLSMIMFSLTSSLKSCYSSLAMSNAEVWGSMEFPCANLCGCKETLKANVAFLLPFKADLLSSETACLLQHRRRSVRVPFIDAYVLDKRWNDNKISYIAHCSAWTTDFSTFGWVLASLVKYLFIYVYVFHTAS